MGKRVIRNKLVFSLFSICILTLLLLSIFIYMFNNKSMVNINNNSRVILNNAVYKSQNNDFSELKNFTYTLIDLNGTVIKSNNKDFAQGSIISLESLSSLTLYSNDINSTYLTPFIVDNVQQGTLYVKIPNSQLNNTHVLYYIPIFILSSIIITICYTLYKIFTTDVLTPINSIHHITNNILNGNLTTPLFYDYDGEIGTLCHDFEKLREDISYSLENEKKLKEKEKLLLAYISHDLKTPIATISGYAEGINSGLVTDTDSIKEYSSIILNKTKLLTSLIDDILEHSKTQINELTMSLKECYSDDFFEKLLLEFKSDTQTRNLSFSYSEIPIVLVNIDEKRIKQVMQNLISNSIKFSKPNGNIHVDFNLYESNLLISVKDNGIGIPSSDLPMIFHDFFRGEKSRTLNVPGSGLGLNIAKYIIEKHGGQIECDSILDVGTTMTFSLPI